MSNGWVGGWMRARARRTLEFGFPFLCEPGVWFCRLRCTACACVRACTLAWAHMHAHMLRACCSWSSWLLPLTAAPCGACSERRPETHAPVLHIERACGPLGPMPQSSFPLYWVLELPFQVPSLARGMCAPAASSGAHNLAGQWVVVVPLWSVNPSHCDDDG